MDSDSRYCKFDNFTIDFFLKEIYRDQEALKLRSKCHDLLFLFLKHPNRVLPHEFILQEVWKLRYSDTSVISQCAGNIRVALTDDRENDRYLINFRGRGYQFNAELEPIDSTEFEQRIKKPAKTLEESVQGSIISEGTAESDAPNQPQQYDAPVSHSELPSRVNLLLDSSWSKRIDNPLPLQNALPQNARQTRRLTVLIAVLGVICTAIFATLFFAIKPLGKIDPELTRIIAFAPTQVLNSDGTPLSIDLEDSDFIADYLNKEEMVHDRKIEVIPASEFQKQLQINNDPMDAARALNAEMVVFPTRKKSGSKTHYTLQLVKTKNRETVKTISVETQESDKKRIKESISQQASEELVSEFAKDDKKAIQQPEAKNSDEYAQHQKGTHYASKRTPQELYKSIDNFQKEIVINPDSYFAYVGLADSYTLLVSPCYLAISPDEARKKAQASITKAREIYGVKIADKNRKFYQADAAEGLLELFHHWDWNQASKNFKYSIWESILHQDNDYIVTARHRFGNLLILQGRFDEGLLQLEKAEKIAPTSVPIKCALGWAYYFQKDYDTAIGHYSDAIDLDENFCTAHSLIGLAYAQKKQYGKAIEALSIAKKLSKDTPLIIAQLACVYALKGDKLKALDMLDELEKTSKANDTYYEPEKISKGKYVSPFCFALIYSSLGDKEKAIVWLEKAYQERSPAMITLKVEPLFSRLQDDPKFKDLLRRLALN